jgi:hypothetical protein
MPEPAALTDRQVVSRLHELMTKFDLQGTVEAGSNRAEGHVDVFLFVRAPEEMVRWLDALSTPAKASPVTARVDRRGSARGNDVFLRVHGQVDGVTYDVHWSTYVDRQSGAVPAEICLGREFLREVVWVNADAQHQIGPEELAKFRSWITSRKEKAGV